VRIVKINDVPVVPEWTLTDRLRKAREHAQLTQKDLATRLGVTATTVSRAERGEGITHRTLLQWAAITDVPLEWINAGSTCACTTCAPGQQAAA
jgi:transcriptional regulator with XRE-family HTH domain